MKKFYKNQEVKVVGFPHDDPLNGEIGTVVGIASNSYGTTFYIVLFNLFGDAWPARVIIDSCLEPAVTYCT